ncbi:MAG: tRNA pseudouridine(38-40) synthase TruA [Clostridia bacterium]|nr:tRNA pseudouridine(38-40) synthase TruA [Clostridia bacterium]
MRYVLKIAYDGTSYAGWQRQKNAVSVQQRLEEALLQALGTEVKVTASGRTDAGVHALGQVCHFDAEVSVPPEKMPDCVNRFLPDDIRAIKGWQAEDGFDSNRSAKRKTYCYRLYEGDKENPLLSRYAVRIENLPEVSLLQDAARLFEGTHDFKAFCASGSSVKTTVRTVYEVKVVKEQVFSQPIISVYVTGNGFLYNMVRTMVGELIEIAAGRKTADSLQKAYETGERNLLGKTMAAKGLTLVDVVYQD